MSLGYIAVLTPVWLHEDAVDLVEGDGASAVTDSFEETGDAQVPDASEDAIPGADDETQRLW